MGRSQYVFVGMRDHGNREIYGYELRPERLELARCSVTDTGPDPSFLSIHPMKDRLYAVNQVPDGE